MTLLGYARISTTAQDAQAQTDALTKAGATRIWTDTASGALKARPQLDELLAYARSGDVIVVWKLDRLGRSLSHLLSVAEHLSNSGIELRSLTEGIDTTTPGGRLVFHTLGAVAEFERDLIRERTHAGLEAARAAGRHPGRPGISDATKERILSLDTAGVPRAEIGRILGVSRSSVYRALEAQAPAAMLDAREAQIQRQQLAAAKLQAACDILLSPEEAADRREQSERQMAASAEFLASPNPFLSPEEAEERYRRWHQEDE